MFKSIPITLLFVMLLLPLPPAAAETATMVYRVCATLPATVSTAAAEDKQQGQTAPEKDPLQTVQTQTTLRDGQWVLVRSVVVL